MADGRTVTIAVDIVTGPNAGAKVKSAIGDVEREVKASQKRISDSQKRHAKIMEDSDKAQARISKVLAKQQADDFIRELKRVEQARKKAEADAKRSSGVFGGVFAGSFLGSAAAQGLSLITSQAQQAGKAVFDFASKMEQSKVSFASLMGNAQLAAKHIKELQDLTVKYPLDFSSIAMMSQRLQGAGIAAEKVIPLIKDIGNVAAATGDLGAERMEGLAVALSQVASKGRVSAEEMEQLAERGVPAWRMLSEAIGKTVGETRKMAEDGKITSDQLFKAFERMSRVNFAGAMERQAKTFSGAMKQIENVVMLTSQTAFDPFYKKISSLAAETAVLVKKQNGSFVGVGSVIGDAIGKGVSIAITEVVKSLPSVVWAALKASMSFWQDLPTQVAGMLASGVHSATNWLGSATGLWNPRSMNPDVAKRFGIATSANTAPLPSIYTNNYSRPGSLSSRTSPSVLNSGGGAMPKTKSSKVNLKVKDDLGQAFDIAAKYGLIVTSGRDGKHNKGSAHGTGEAIDLRTNGVPDAVLRAAMAEFSAAGYNVKDERVRPNGQKVWSGSHLHVSSRGRAIGGGRMGDPNAGAEAVINFLRNESNAKTEAYRDEMVDQFIYAYGRTGILPTKEMLDRIVDRVGEYAEMRGDRRPETSEVERDLANVWYTHLARRMPSVSAEATTLGTVADLNLRKTEDIPEDPAIKEAQRRNQEIWENFRREQEDAFEDARQSWDGLLTDLANGDFKSVWRNLKNAMLQQFIQPASQMLAQLFGNPFGGRGGFGGGGFGGGGGFSIPGFGGMGPGGTPMFNGNNFAGSGSGGGFSLGSLFGGGGGGFNLGSLFGRSSSGGGALGGALGNAASVGGFGGGFKSGIRGMGGGSLLAGSAGLGGMAATLIGGAVGGKWGNFLSMAGMGTQIGAQFGPWGALIGGAIGAGAGLISMLFGRDNAEKKLKEAALSTYGITVKDKSVLKSLKALGETMFGKGNVGKNAAQVVSSDEGQLILRNYAEASNQSSKKIDALYVGDETWKGNQFRSKFGGYRAMGGPVTAGMSYIVGERQAEVFTPSQNGHISPSVGGLTKEDRTILGGIAEALYMFTEKFGGISPGQVIQAGAAENPEAFGRAVRTDNSNSLRGSEMFFRASGAY